MNSIYLAVPIMSVLVIIQSAILPRFPIFGLVPQTLLLVSLVWGLLHGPEEGVAWAFIAGFFMDLFSSGPVGLSALALMAAVLVAALIQHNLPVSRFLLPVLLAALATFIFLFTYFLLLQALRYPFGWQAAASLLPLVPLHAFLILPIYWLTYTLDRMLRPRRVEI